MAGLGVATNWNYWLTAGYAAEQRRVWNSKFPSPLTDRLRLSGVRNDMGVATLSPVICLFLGRCPSTVFRTVVACVIATVYGMLWRRPRPHISNKIGKRISPSVADSYAPPTVVIVAPCLRVIATMLHPGPDPIFSGTVSSPCASVYRLSRSRSNGSHASATNRVVGSKVTTPNLGAPAAIALTTPQVLPSRKCAYIREHYEFSKSPAAKIFHTGTLRC